MNEDALKQRLVFIVNQTGKQHQEVWKQLLLERFLSRVSKSAHQDKFIFKGGLLLAQYLEIGRETTDLDFLIKKIKNEASIIQKIIEEIILENEVSDGFIFSFDSIEELKQPHMDYAGFRVNLNAQFNKMKGTVQLDIGFGDAVIPDEDIYRPFEYKGKPIFEGEITLMVYPVETIFAEKLETIISKGSSNSRMKDYHDVLLMMREKGLLEVNKLKSCVNETFKNRETALSFPIAFNEVGMTSLSVLWKSHVQKLGKVSAKLGIGSDFVLVLAEINEGIDRFGLSE
jgi:predicted nucleotidyltransferase component of viral defense system